VRLFQSRPFLRYGHSRNYIKIVGWTSVQHVGLKPDLHNNEICSIMLFCLYIRLIMKSLIDRLQLSTDELHVTKVAWSHLEILAADHTSSDLAKQTRSQLDDYFHYAHSDWNLPLLKCGTQFQQKVWHHLQTIPLGETRYYSDVAKALNSSAQAVGNACRANPFVIIVPCHRVVSKAGLGGYDGQTSGKNLAIKQWLLDHERK